MKIDARVPVRFGTLSERAAGDAVLTDGAEVTAPGAVFEVGAGHLAGCACCIARSGAAKALAGLFRARAVELRPAFLRVLVAAGPEGQAAVRKALDADAFVSGRFRLA